MPIVCVGELLAEREAGQTAEVIRRQFDGSLAGLTAEQMGRIVIAYEPVWAIGTGKVATPEQAEEVHADLRNLLAERYNTEVAEAVRIQYGGSVKAGNAAELLAQPNIDGALVGGASLKADEFLGIVAAPNRRDPIPVGPIVARLLHRGIATLWPEGRYLQPCGKSFYMILLFRDFRVPDPAGAHPARPRRRIWPGPSAAWVVKAPSAPRPATCSPGSRSSRPRSGSSSVPLRSSC